MDVLQTSNTTPLGIGRFWRVYFTISRFLCFGFFSEHTFAPFWSPTVKNRSRGVSEHVRCKIFFRVVSGCDWYVHSSIFSSIGEDVMIWAQKLNRGGEDWFCPPRLRSTLSESFKYKWFGTPPLPGGVWDKGYIPKKHFSFVLKTYV